MEKTTSKPPHIISRMGIAYLPQINNVFANLTVKISQWQHMHKRVDAITENFKDIRIVSVSATENWIQSRYAKRRTKTDAMAMALMREPKVMLFDEPTANLAPKMALEVMKKISQMREEFDATIVLVEQNVKRALQIGDMAYLVVNGKLAYSGTAKELAAHPDLGKLYLGTG